MTRGFTKPLKPFGLPHHMYGVFELSMENTQKRATHIPIAIADKSKTGAEDIVTAPGHKSFAGVQDTPMCFLDSTIGRVRIGMTVSMPASGQETGIKGLFWNLGIFGLSFEDIEADDPDDGVALTTLYGLEKDSNADFVRPQYNGTDINGGTAQSLYVGAQSEMGLTGGDNIEGVNYNAEVIEMYLRRGGMKSKIKKTLGGFKDMYVQYEQPYKMNRTWFDPPSNTKRMNEFTYFGLGIELPQAGGDMQFYDADETTAVNHLRIGYDIYYTEYNDAFARN